MANLFTGLVVLFAAWAAIVGYAMNIIIMSHATELSIVLAIRILGVILFPIGIIAGYL